MKLSEVVPASASYGDWYFQPAANGTNAPTQWLMRGGNSATGTQGDMPNPPDSMANGRWNCFEVRYNHSGHTTTGWLDDQLMATDTATASDTVDYVLFGIPNYSGANATFDLWFDNYTMSSSRIYCSSIVEIADGSTYATATKRRQALTSLADGTIVITADLTGLGAGPYYLFVRNNKQEQSAAFELGGGGGDSTAPTVTAGDTTKAISSNSYAATGTCYDAVGVIGSKWRIGSAPDANNGTACTGTTSWACATSGYAEGANTLYVACYDVAGLYGTDTVAVTYTPTGGGTSEPPSCTIDPSGPGSMVFGSGGSFELAP